MLINAYVLYRTAHQFIWKTDKKKILSQYQFREEIVKAWMLEEPNLMESSKSIPKAR